VQITRDYANPSIFQAYAPPRVNPNTNSTRTVQDAIAVINEIELLGFDRELRYSTDPQSKLGVVQVLSRSSGQVIAQIPSELILDFAQNLQNGN
jgi:uncharacterized FlaG/YvyC family protein